METVDHETEGSGGRVPGGIKRGPREQALAIIFATAIEENEGFRTGALGTPRFGKTYHLKEVVDRALELGVIDLAVVHDIKKTYPQYEGAVRHGYPPEPLRPDESAVMVFCRAPGAVEVVTLDQASRFALEQGRAGTPTLILADELYNGLKDDRVWEKTSDGAPPAFPYILREGSSQRVSSAWTTQIPQSLPNAPMNLSETIAIFNLAGRSLSYVLEQLRLHPDAQHVIRRLKKGEFILWTMHGDWDRTIYGPR